MANSPPLISLPDTTKFNEPLYTWYVKYSDGTILEEDEARQAQGSARADLFVGAVEIGWRPKVGLIHRYSSFCKVYRISIGDKETPVLFRRAFQLVSHAPVYAYFIGKTGVSSLESKIFAIQPTIVINYNNKLIMFNGIVEPVPDINFRCKLEEWMCRLFSAKTKPIE